MDKVNPSRVDVSSLSPLLLIVAAVVAVIVFAALPTTRRLYIMVTFTVAWSMVGQLIELPLHSIAKATFAFSLVLVALAALLHRGPRLRVSPAVLWWPILGAFAVLFVLYLDSWAFALLLRIQWIILCVAAILVARTIVDRESADAMARSLGVGLMLSIAIAATSVFKSGASAFHIGRFSPYGANANQVGVVFAAAVPFALYCALRARHKLTRWMSVATAAAAIGMVVMTASRTSVVVTALLLLPFFLNGLRRSVAIVGAVAIGAMVIVPFAYTPEIKPAQEETEQYGMGRLDSLETGRVEIFARYLDESVSKRPITGLFGVAEKSVLRDDDIGMHPHNAYLEMMYIGGVLYTLPMLFLAVATIVAAVRIFLARARLPIDPLLATIVAFLLLAVYIHAMVGGNAYYPTSAWPFLHVLASTLVLSVAAWLSRDARGRHNVRARRSSPVLVAAVLQRELASTHVD